MDLPLHPSAGGGNREVGEGMRHTPIDIVNLQFPRAVRGYQCEPVRRFLAEVADDLESVIRDRAELIEQVEALKEQVDRFTAMETAIKSAAITAERNADQTRENARQQAENTLREAELHGREILADARRESAQLRAEIDRLRAERDRFIFEYTARLRAELELFERLRAESTDAEPEATASASEEQVA